MKVAVDARALTDSSSFRGIGTYFTNVLPGVAAAPGIEVVAIGGSRSALPDGVELVPMRRLAPDRFADAEHDILLPRALRRVAPDVAWSPALDPPKSSPAPWVQTLHDVIPLVLDDPWFAVERKRWVRYRSRFAEAAAVIAISRHCADEGIRVLGLDPSRVHVVHHGVDPVFNPGPDPLPLAARERLLYVGEYDARKGWPEAFEVAAIVADAGFPHPLEVASVIAPWYKGEIDALHARARRPERVTLLGYVNHKTELPDLYRRSAVLCVTSRYEGFGLPTVEAMASGTPVVAFDNTATTEVVGDGGTLVPDGDAAAFGRAVADLLGDEARWKEASERALARAADFDWSRTVDAHVEVLRSVGGG